MTVGEMIKVLKQYDEEMIVEIRVRNPSDGPSRGTGIRSISKGIDWYDKRLFIFSEKHLVEVI